MVFLIQQTMIYAVPLMIVALAGVCAERSGVINLALEGIMIFGAFMGVLFVRMFQDGGWTQDQQGPIPGKQNVILTFVAGIVFIDVDVFYVRAHAFHQFFSGILLRFYSQGRKVIFSCIEPQSHGIKQCSVHIKNNSRKIHDVIMRKSHPICK